MISLNTIAESIETGLNANDKNIKFAIFTDAGEYKKAISTRTEKQRFTNGFLQSVSSSLVPTQSITVATQSVLLNIVVKLPFKETEKQIIDDHRAVLENYFGKYKTDLMPSDGKTYSVTWIGGFADTGTVEVRAGIGTSVSFSVSIQYSFIENGLNSSNCVFELDGNVIPYSMAQISRRPTVESNPYSNTDTESKNVATTELVGFEFQVPAQSGENPLASLLLRQVLFGNHRRHTLNATIGKETATYSVIFGESALAIQGIDNAGHKFSLISAASSV